MKSEKGSRGAPVSALPPTYMIQGVTHHFDGINWECGPSSAVVLLDFYGQSYSKVYLKMISNQAHGFGYRRDPMAFPEVNGSFESFYMLAQFDALQKVGCKITIIKNKPWEEMWEIMKCYVADDIPVLIDYVLHRVVLVGYDETKGIVYVNDPAFGPHGERGWKPSQNPEVSGNYLELKIEEFRANIGEPPRAFCVIDSLSKPSKLDLGDVLKKNALLTLGKFEEATGLQRQPNAVYGPEGLLAYASDYKKGFGIFEQPPEEAKMTLYLIQRVTCCGNFRSRLQASAFLEGLAAATSNENLHKASYYYESSAIHFETVWLQTELIENELDKPTPSWEFIEKWLNRGADQFRAAAECDRQAGESLLRGAEAFTRRHSGRRGRR